jgi:hypothetical protein
MIIDKLIIYIFCFIFLFIIFQISLRYQLKLFHIFLFNLIDEKSINLFLYIYFSKGIESSKKFIFI